MRGLESAYTDSGIYLERNVWIDGQQYSASVVSLVGRDEHSVTDLTLNAYFVRGVDQSAWTRLLYTEIVIQIAVMVVEIVANVCSLLLSYLPMRNFLNLLERTFTVPSMSQHERMVMDQKAAKMMASQEDNAENAGGTTTSNHKSIYKAKKPVKT
uniref:Uncharacterized protein n=1 Tax=Spongospora subterranea TaxID=70186 RepID=A0A0H5R8S1_9EUKA|eukprot:CRZ04769.1 hypothetical protein [Spongospora subterranea]